MGGLIRCARPILSHLLPTLLLVLAVAGNVMILAGGAPILLWEIWGPNQVIIPMTLLVLCASRLLVGRLDVLFPATVALVLASHNHLGTLAVTVPLCGLGLAAVLFHRRRGTLQPLDKGTRVAAMASGAFLILASWPIFLPMLLRDRNQKDPSADPLILKNGFLPHGVWT